MSNCQQTNSLYNLSQLDAATVQDACTASACKYSANPSQCVGVRRQDGTCVRAERVAGGGYGATAGYGAGIGGASTMSPTDILNGGGALSGQAPNSFQFTSQGQTYGATRSGCNVIGVGSAVAQLSAYVPATAGLKPVWSYGIDQQYINPSGLASSDYQLGACGQGGWGNCNGY